MNKYVVFSCVDIRRYDWTIVEAESADHAVSDAYYLGSNRWNEGSIDWEERDFEDCGVVRLTPQTQKAIDKGYILNYKHDFEDETPKSQFFGWYGTVD